MVTVFYTFVPTASRSMADLQQVLCNGFVTAAQGPQELLAFYEELLVLLTNLVTTLRFLTTATSFTSADVVLRPDFQQVQTR